MFLIEAQAKILSVVPSRKNQNDEAHVDTIKLSLVYEFTELLSKNLGDVGYDMYRHVVNGPVVSVALRVPTNELVANFRSMTDKKDKLKVKNTIAAKCLIKAPNAEDPNPILHASFTMPWVSDEQLTWLANHVQETVLVQFDKIQSELPGVA